MPKTILAVDDSLLTHQMYKVFLQRYGACRILTAMNGIEALETLQREPDVDVILLDVSMPQMNGPQFLEKLQQDEAHRAVPVIVISGGEEEKEHVMRLGARAFLKKPFQADELRSTIEQILGPGLGPH
jgi:CheY-like chemotaxis protein